ncbi:MAG TPA: MASE1 domain-containing protein [Gemmatimonadaceae bacterium]|nr:MASE1 domain-containing protein [Gemmatimonadaceae bacterium]
MSHGVLATGASVAGKPGVGSDEAAAVRAYASVGLYALLLASAYYLSARLGLAFRFANSQVSIIWPSNAVMLSALLLAPPRRWWLVMVACGLAHVAAMAGAIPPWRIAWQLCANAAFVLTTAFALRWFSVVPMHLESRRQVFVFTVVAFASPVVFSLTTPSFIRSLLGVEPSYSPGVNYLRTTLSNATGMLLVVPVVVLSARRWPTRLMEMSRRRIAEAALMTLSLLAVGLVVFTTGPEIARYPSLLLWIIPPLLWAAVRFGPVGTSTSLLVVAVLSVWGTARQLGPFVLRADDDQVLSLQLFWIVLSQPAMLLAAVIREREQTEQAFNDQRNQLAHVTRVATVGEMSGALAHELRQPLMSILANAQAAQHLLAREPGNVASLNEMLQDIVQQDRQAALVISRVRSFQRGGESPFEMLAMESVVRDALALARSAMVISGVDVQLHAPAGLPRVRGDPVQLLQVMVNLIVNSCEAMDARTGVDRRLNLRLSSNGTGHLHVSVSDSGAGLPASGEDRVFQPFFTTKSKGLGLGLAVCRSIATAHRGRLWGENNPEGGATFHLLLPTDPGHAEHTTVRRDS